MLQNSLQKTEDTKNARLGLLVAGIVAGAAGVTALALSDKDIRKKVSKRANEARVSLQKWSSEKLHERTASKNIDGESIDETTETLTMEEQKVKN